MPTRAQTINWTTRRIKPSLAEMGILAIADAHHQRWPNSTPRLRPVKPLTSCSDHGSICRYINTVNTCSCKNRTKVSYGKQILITSTTDQFHPRPTGQGKLTAYSALLQRTNRNSVQASSKVFIGCQWRLRAPPISTTTRKRGSRLQISQSARSSDLESTCPSKSQSTTGSLPTNNSPN